MWVLLVLMAVTLWFVSGLLDALRKRAGDRLAVWLLPTSQAATFRVAYILARGAGAIAPVRYEPIISHVFSLTPEYPVARIDVPVEIIGHPLFWSGRLDDGEPWAAIPTVPDGSYVRFLGRADDNQYGVANPRLHATAWETPQAAIAELEADLAAEKRVAQPIQLVLPLLAEALLIRWRNIGARTVVARTRWAIKHGTDDQCGDAVAAISRQEIPT